MDKLEEIYNSINVGSRTQTEIRYNFYAKVSSMKYLLIFMFFLSTALRDTYYTFYQQL
jgi:hypothetical protein